MQDRIRELCKQLLDATDADEVERIAAELQAAIHEHVESLRLSIVALTVLPYDTPKKAA